MMNPRPASLGFRRFFTQMIPARQLATLAAARPSPSDLLLEPPSVAVLVASLLMWGSCRSAPSALRVSFASKSNHAVLALRAYNLKGEP